MDELSGNFILDCMTKLEHHQIAENVFRANWSSDDVDHLIFFELSEGMDSSDPFLQAEYGIRYLRANQFVLRAYLNYVPNSKSKSIRFDPNFDCLIKVDFGFFGHERVFNWRLWLRDLDTSGICDSIEQKIGTDVYPLVKSINTKRDIFRFLVSDKEPFRWFRSNPLLRAAAVVFLGVELRLDQEQILNELSLQSQTLKVQGGVHDVGEFVAATFNACVHHEQL